jgi:RNA polymerase sigma-70 factor, ECF subfamily
VTDRQSSPQTEDVALEPLQIPGPGPAPTPDPDGLPTPAPTLRAIFIADAPYVVHSLRRLGVRERDLEDLSHDVFLTVHRHLHEYDPARPIRPWLFGIAFRVALAYRRRAGHQREVAHAVVEAVDEGPAADEQLASREARRLVQAALEALEPDRRAVFVMHDLDGAAMPDIAAALAIPLNTGYSRLRLARKDFAAAVTRLRRGRGES